MRERRVGPRAGRAGDGARRRVRLDRTSGGAARDALGVLARDDLLDAVRVQDRPQGVELGRALARRAEERTDGGPRVGLARPGRRERRLGVAHLGVGGLELALRRGVLLRRRLDGRDRGRVPVAQGRELALDRRDVPRRAVGGLARGTHVVVRRRGRRGRREAHAEREHERSGGPRHGDATARRAPGHAVHQPLLGVSR
ncbi:hypothetical protein [Cellulosimicrobium sp. TH-20]|uniref:hypothetical protein n=1 Tax=Cellulosimicrobium sp. TH-20 TaxID=1980001 RepID=UPI0011A47CDD|nr:hypothetical protein [Cellulosimicrobium sp. TH-20]